jgi:phospholipase/carboxylesterase
MNRISAQPAPKTLVASPATPKNSAAPAKFPLWQPSLSRGAPSRILTPLHYERNYAYPLVVWLHGAGGDETQVERVMPHVSLRNHAAAAPRAAGSVWEQTHAGIQHAERAVFEAIDAAQSRLNIAPDRIFLAGYQDGAVMALRVAMRRPHSFAGAASLCGPFPRGLQPLARLKQVRRLPILMMYGQQGTRYSIDAMCNDLELFHTAGLQVALRQYPCGDEMTTTMLQDLDSWIMEHVTGDALLDCER